MPTWIVWCPADPNAGVLSVPKTAYGVGDPAVVNAEIARRLQVARLAFEVVAETPEQAQYLAMMGLAAGSVLPDGVTMLKNNAGPHISTAVAAGIAARDRALGEWLARQGLLVFSTDGGVSFKLWLGSKYGSHDVRLIEDDSAVVGYRLHLLFPFGLRQNHYSIALQKHGDDLATLEERVAAAFNLLGMVYGDIAKHDR